MRRHVAARSSADSTGGCFIIFTSATSGGLVDGCHGILERTAGCKVLSAANTTLDLLVLELILHAALLAAVLLRLRSLCLPVDAGSESDVLTDGGSIERGSGSVALLETELGPGPPLRNLGVDMFANDGGLDPAGDLHLLALIVEAVRHNGLGAIFVRCDLLRGERGGVIELLVVGPVGAAAESCKNFMSEDSRRRGFMGSGLTYFASLDIVLYVVICKCC